MEKRVTIKDVARQAGVSVASVSYVLNGVNKVNTQTRQRILEAIEEMNYRPSMMAKCLSDGVSRLIGLALPITERGDIPGMLFENNPFFSEFLSGIEMMTRSEGYDILISGLDAGKAYKDWIQSRALDGLIILGLYPQDIYKEIRNFNIPVVLTDTYEPYAAGFHRVMVDDELGGYMAAKHLIDLGHTEIAIAIGSIANSEVNARRYAGFIRALDESGIKGSSALILEGNMSLEGGIRLGERFIREKVRSTGIFVGADIAALGIIKALNKSGVRVPKDVSVIGFDDIKFSELSSPGLTTIRQDSVLKGKTAAKLILDDLKRGEQTQSLVTLPIQLIIRDSTQRKVRS